VINMASFFDSLLAPFTGSAQEQAAQAQQQGLQNAYSQYSGLNQQALQNLQNYYGQGQNYLGNLYGQATGAINQLYPQATGAINQLYPQAAGALAQFLPQAQQTLAANYMQGLAPVQQNIGTAQTGTNQLLNMLGLGPQGAAGAQSALAQTPGYQFALDQGTQNVLRNQAATGQLASGATNVDLTNYAQGLANQTYQNAVNNLQPFLGYGTTNAANALQGYGQLGQGLSNIFGQAGTGLAGLLTGQANALTPILTGQGNQLAGLYGQQGQLGTQGLQNLGQGVAGLLGNQASAAYGTQAGIGNAQANAALAPLQAGNNMWNLAGNIAKMAMGLPPTGNIGGGGTGTGTGTGTGGGGTLGGNFLSGLGSGASSLFGSFNPSGGVNANWAAFGQ